MVPGCCRHPSVTALLDRLSALKRGLPIATSESALKRFKVVDADFERRLVLSAGDKALATVYFGSSPGLRKSDARFGTDKAVYTVDLPTYELPTDSGAWLSPDLLRGDTAKLAEIDIANGAAKGLVSGRMQLVRTPGTDKQPDSWADPGLAAGQHLDGARAQALAQQLGQLHVDAVLQVRERNRKTLRALRLGLAREALVELHHALPRLRRNSDWR